MKKRGKVKMCLHTRLHASNNNNKERHCCSLVDLGVHRKAQMKSNCLFTTNRAGGFVAAMQAQQ